MPKLTDVMTIKQATECFRGSQNTLRSWGRHGRIKEWRQPVTRQPLNHKVDVDDWLKQVDKVVLFQKPPRTGK